MSNMAMATEKKSAFQRFIKGVEIVGNKLPHPFWLFTILGLITIILSVVLSKLGVSVTYMAAKAGEAPAETTVAVQNLMNYKLMRGLLSDFIRTYVNFTPLGYVVTLMLGIGIVEQTGMISALMRKTVLSAPPYLVTGAIAMVGINANLASDAGIIFTPVIGASVFKALGRNPWVGIIAGFAASSSGYTANFFIAGTDALLAGITQSAAESMSIPGPTHPLINWYFMIFSTITMTIATVWVTEKFTVKILGGDDPSMRDPEELKKHAVTPAENRGLKYSAISFVIYLAILLALTIPQGSFFRADNGQIVPTSPLLSSIVPILFLLFFIVGSAYGFGAGIIKSAADVPGLMAKGLQGSLSFLVVVLPASIFIALFRLSCLDTVISVKGADWLIAVNLNGLPLLIMFILLVTTINLFMMSGSAKWLILAPIFVPMLGRVGFPPALTQVAYRVGDTATNIICPLSYYIPVVISLLDQYKKKDDIKVGIGSVMSLCMPYSMAYLAILTIQLVVWYVFDLPLGPGTPVRM